MRRFVYLEKLDCTHEFHLNQLIIEKPIKVRSYLDLIFIQHREKERPEKEKSSLSRVKRGKREEPEKERE